MGRRASPDLRGWPAGQLRWRRSFGPPRLQADRDARPASAVNGIWGVDAPWRGRKLRRRIAALVAPAGRTGAHGDLGRRGSAPSGAPGVALVALWPPSASGQPVPAGLQRSHGEEAGESFLNGYLEPDGRVARRDQGGDTVSEGQAYAMLVAAALNDRQRFTRVWAWTKRNLVREDGRLAWRWKEDRSSTMLRFRRRPRRGPRPGHRGGGLR